MQNNNLTMWAILSAILLIASLTEAKLRTDVTVSGLSSGGAFAAQLHLAYSSLISGSGIIAGPPYYCAQGTILAAITECLYGPAALIPVSKLEQQLQSYVSAGSADPISHIKNDPVYIFSGTNDYVVAPDVVKVNEQIYSSVGARIKTNYAIPSAHGFVTDNFGGPCSILDMEYYINNCNFNLAYDILNHLFGGNLTKPDPSNPPPLKGQLVTIEQPALMNARAVNSTGANIYSYWAKWLETSIATHKPSFGYSLNTLPTFKLPGISSASVGASGFDREGYVYYPSGCGKGKKCPIHVALHGCQQGKARIGDTYVKHTGYLEVAELNHIIILFPQIVATFFNPSDPEGCWDWWGYDDPNYANKLGTQMAGLKKMIDSLRAINDELAA